MISAGDNGHGSPSRGSSEGNLPAVTRLVRAARFTVALTGAGVSTASGIPDFRSPGTGLWSRYDPTQVASLSAFRRDPYAFWSFYSQRFLSLGDVTPNPAHYALASLERAGLLRGLITQNIDRLHYKAGSEHLLEVHGSIAQANCLVCGLTYPREQVLEMLEILGAVPTCECGSVLKPGVVLFEEDLPQCAFAQASRWAEQADLFLVAGSSLEVWPVAGLPELAVQTGAQLLIVNGSPTPFDDLAVAVERSPVELFLPRLVQAVTGSSV